MTVDVYIFPASPPCRSVLMTAKYLGLDINQKIVNLREEEHLKPEFLKINPNHCLPTIDDGGFYLWESRAIMTYLVNKYAPESSLYPKEPRARAIVDKMLYFDVDVLEKAQTDFVVPQLKQAKPADPVKEAEFKKSLSLLEKILTNSSYAAGSHVTVVDISIFSRLTFVETVFSFDLSEFPKISSWMQKLKKEVPGHQEINEKPLEKVKEIIKARGH